MNSLSKLSWSERYQKLAQSARDPQLKVFYEAGVPSESLCFKDASFVALDFETTGLNPERDEIVSIGLVPFSYRRILCRQSMKWMVRPQQGLTEDSVKIHGITHSVIHNAPDFEHVLKPLLEALAGKLVVAHYRSIERNFLNKALTDRISETVDLPMLDTMQIEADTLRASRSWLDRLLMRKMPSIRLGACRERYGLPFYKPHDALIDAIATAELLQAQMQWLELAEVPVSEYLC